MEAHEMAVLKTNKMFEMLTRQRDDALNFIVNQSGRIAELEMNIQELQEKYNAAIETITKIQGEKIKEMIPEATVQADSISNVIEKEQNTRSNTRFNRAEALKGLPEAQHDKDQ